MVREELVPRKKDQFRWKNFGVCFLLSLGCWGFGYPSSVIGPVLAEPAFLVYFNLIDLQTSKATDYGNSIIGGLNGVYQAGAFIGVFLTCFVSDKYGRRWAMHWNCLLGIIGGAILAASVHIAMAMVARFILGASAWGFLTLTPIYTSELSPAAWRGFFVGLNGVNISFGYALAAYMGLAFSYAGKTTPSAEFSMSNATWRGPLGLYLFVPILMIFVTIVSPESPRWLLMNGREAEAREILFRLHTDKDGDTTFVEEEFSDMVTQIETQKHLKVSWFDMFTKQAYKRRTYVSLFYSFLGQSTGVLVLNNYGPSFYSALGYGTSQQLVFQAGWVTVAYPFCFFGALLMDRLGRRPLMIGAVAGCGICVAVLAAATARVSDGSSVAALGVAAIYIFIAIYSIGVDVGGNVFYSEVFQNHVRAKGVALANAVLALSDLLYLELTPTAQAQVGWKWFLLFVCISAVGSVVLYFVLPETNGVSLERMAHLFGDNIEDGVLGVGDGHAAPTLAHRQQQQHHDEEGGAVAGGGLSISSTDKEATA